MELVITRFILILEIIVTSSFLEYQCGFVGNHIIINDMILFDGAHLKRLTSLFCQS